MKKALQMNLTNRDEIAGLPALSVAEFLADDESALSCEDLRSWFHLDDREAGIAFRRLIEEGYLESRTDGSSEESTTTARARDVVASAPAPALTTTDCDNIVLALLTAIREINTSPATAHRVGAAKIIGSNIERIGDLTSIVEAVIELRPLAHIVSIQSEIEELALEYAVKHSEHADGTNNAHAASIHLIHDQLLDAHERLSLRFVIG
jgi:hypothetical protein